MKRRRVFAVISSSEIGGAEILFASLLSGLSAQGCEVFAAHPGSGPMAADYRARAAKSFPLDMRVRASPGAVFRLTALMRESGAELAHTHLWNADIVGGRAALRAGLPVIATLYGASHLPLGVSGLTRLRRQALSLVYRGAYTGFDRLIALSNYIRDDASSRPGIKVDRDAIEIIYPCIDGSRLPKQTAVVQERGGAGRTILSVANFFPVKGHEWLVRALPEVFSRHPDARCVLTSQGPERSRIQGLARRLGVSSRVEFTGALSDAELSRRWSEADVFVLPSLSEGLPLTILEAFARGVPVVASRAGGIPEAVEDQVSGLLVPARDPASLACAISSVLSDRAMARRLAESGARTLAARFSPGEMVRRTIDLYDRVLAERRP